MSKKEGFKFEPRLAFTSEEVELLDYFKPSASWRVRADVTLTPDEEPFDMTTYSGLKRSYRKWGVANFSIQGQKQRLALYENMAHQSNPIYRDYLFLPFRDLTNGESTYGGGRYIDLTKSALNTDGTIIIDFNLCYNPLCAYSEGFNCPIPPKENHLEIAVMAGEKKYRGEVKKSRE